MRSLTFKLLAFNLLLVFLPIGSILYLDTYEKQLLQNLERSMVQQGRIFSAALEDSSHDNPDPQIIRQRALQLLDNLEQNLTARIRVIDRNGYLLADSAVHYQIPADPDHPVSTDMKDSYDIISPEVRDSLLYQLAVKPVKAVRQLLYPPDPPLPSGEYYSGKEILMGEEVLAALSGRYGATTRISTGGQRSVNLYSALPVYSGDEVSSVVLVNQSTYRILGNLYGIRMDIINIFFISIAASITLSIILSLTITHPIRKLGREAEQVLDDNGAVKAAFSRLRRKDEIGSLARSLSILSGRLVKRITFIDSFYSDILHELKNPLSAIRSAAEVMESESSEWQHPFLHTIQEESNRINRILSELRELARIDTRIEVEHTETVDLADFTEKTARAYGDLHQKTIRMEFDGMERDCLIEVNPARLRQVIINLLENARSFCSPCVPEMAPDSPPAPNNAGDTAYTGLPAVTHHKALGHIMIRINRVYTGNTHLCELIIEDDGPGIFEEHIDRIFDRFYSNRQNRDNHSGLGLSICRAIIEGYSGTIHAENRTTGGARIIIRFPVKKR